MKYKLFIERAANKELSKISHKEQKRTINAIKNLSDNPRPAVVKKLTGRDACGFVLAVIELSMKYKMIIWSS